MSYYKRKRRGPGTGQKPSGGSTAHESAQILVKDFNLRKEMDYIVQAASRGDARIVSVGGLVFFSTGDGDAWLLDVEDNLALCLMRGFERCEVEVQDGAETFSIRWDSTFAIEEGCFLVASQSGKATAYPGYPISALERAIQRARKATRAS